MAVLTPSALDLILSALAGWRLASMLVNEAGPFGWFASLRFRVGLRPITAKDASGKLVTQRVALNTVAELFSCVWCMAVWTTALVSIPWWPVEVVRFLLAWYAPVWCGGGSRTAGGNAYTHMYAAQSVSYTHLTLPTTPYV
jgi:hypothetical protein